MHRTTRLTHYLALPAAMITAGTIAFVLMAGIIGMSTSSSSADTPGYPNSTFAAITQVGMTATNLDPGAGYNGYAVGYTYVSDDGTRSVRGSWTGYTDAAGLFEGYTSSYAVTRGLPGTLTMWVYETGTPSVPIVGAGGTAERATVHLP